MEIRDRAVFIWSPKRQRRIFSLMSDMYGQFDLENQEIISETEREALGVGWDISISLKLFLALDGNE